MKSIIPGNNLTALQKQANRAKDKIESSDEVAKFFKMILNNNKKPDNEKVEESIILNLMTQVISDQDIDKNVKSEAIGKVSQASMTTLLGKSEVELLAEEGNTETLNLIYKKAIAQRKIQQAVQNVIKDYTDQGAVTQLLTAISESKTGLNGDQLLTQTQINHLVASIVSTKTNNDLLQKEIAVTQIDEAVKKTLTDAITAETDRRANETPTIITAVSDIIREPVQAVGKGSFSSSSANLAQRRSDRFEAANANALALATRLSEFQDLGYHIDRNTIINGASNVKQSLGEDQRVTDADGFADQVITLANIISLAKTAKTTEEFENLYTQIKSAIDKSREKEIEAIFTNIFSDKSAVEALNFQKQFESAQIAEGANVDGGVIDSSSKAIEMCKNAAQKVINEKALNDIKSAAEALKTQGVDAPNLKENLVLAIHAANQANPPINQEAIKTEVQKVIGGNSANDSTAFKSAFFYNDIEFEGLLDYESELALDPIINAADKETTKRRILDVIVAANKAKAPAATDADFTSLYSAIDVALTDSELSEENIKTALSNALKDKSANEVIDFKARLISSTEEARKTVINDILNDVSQESILREITTAAEALKTQGVGAPNLKENLVRAINAANQANLDIDQEAIKTEVQKAIGGYSANDFADFKAAFENIEVHEDNASALTLINTATDKETTKRRIPDVIVAANKAKAPAATDADFTSLYSAIDAALTDFETSEEENNKTNIKTALRNALEGKSAVEALFFKQKLLKAQAKQALPEDEGEKTIVEARQTKINSISQDVVQEVINETSLDGITKAAQDLKEGSIENSILKTNLVLAMYAASLANPPIEQDTIKAEVQKAISGTSANEADKFKDELNNTIANLVRANPRLNDTSVDIKQNIKEAANKETRNRRISDIEVAAAQVKASATPDNFKALYNSIHLAVEDLSTPPENQLLTAIRQAIPAGLAGKRVEEIEKFKDQMSEAANNSALTQEQKTAVQNIYEAAAEQEQQVRKVQDRDHKVKKAQDGQVKRNALGGAGSGRKLRAEYNSITPKLFTKLTVSQIVSEYVVKLDTEKEDGSYCTAAELADKLKENKKELARELVDAGYKNQSLNSFKEAFNEHAIVAAVNANRGKLEKSSITTGENDFTAAEAFQLKAEDVFNAVQARKNINKAQKTRVANIPVVTTVTGFGWKREWERWDEMPSLLANKSAKQIIIEHAVLMDGKRGDLSPVDAFNQPKSREFLAQKLAYAGYANRYKDENALKSQIDGDVIAHAIKHNRIRNKLDQRDVDEIAEAFNAGNIAKDLFPYMKIATNVVKAKQSKAYGLDWFAIDMKDKGYGFDVKSKSAEQIIIKHAKNVADKHPEITDWTGLATEFDKTKEILAAALVYAGHTSFKKPDDLQKHFNGDAIVTSIAKQRGETLEISDFKTAAAAFNDPERREALFPQIEVEVAIEKARKSSVYSTPLSNTRGIFGAKQPIEQMIIAYATNIDQTERKWPKDGEEFADSLLANTKDLATIIAEAKHQKYTPEQFKTFFNKHAIVKAINTARKEDDKISVDEVKIFTDAFAGKIDKLSTQLYAEVETAKEVLAVQEKSSYGVFRPKIAEQIILNSFLTASRETDVVDIDSLMTEFNKEDNLKALSSELVKSGNAEIRPDKLKNFIKGQAIANAINEDRQERGEEKFEHAALVAKINSLDNAKVIAEKVAIARDVSVIEKSSVFAKKEATQIILDHFVKISKKHDGNVPNTVEDFEESFNDPKHLKELSVELVKNGYNYDEIKLNKAIKSGAIAQKINDARDINLVDKTGAVVDDAALATVIKGLNTSALAETIQTVKDVNNMKKESAQGRNADQIILKNLVKLSLDNADTVKDLIDAFNQPENLAALSKKLVKHESVPKEAKFEDIISRKAFLDIINQERVTKGKDPYDTDTFALKTKLDKTTLFAAITSDVERKNYVDIKPRSGELKPIEYLFAEYASKLAIEKENGSPKYSTVDEFIEALTQPNSINTFATLLVKSSPLKFDVNAINKAIKSFVVSDEVSKAREKAGFDALDDADTLPKKLQDLQAGKQVGEKVVTQIAIIKKAKDYKKAKAESPNSPEVIISNFIIDLAKAGKSNNKYRPNAEDTEELIEGIKSRSEKLAIKLIENGHGDLLKGDGAKLEEILQSNAEVINYNANKHRMKQGKEFSRIDIADFLGANGQQSALAEVMMEVAVDARKSYYSRSSVKARMAFNGEEPYVEEGEEPTKKSGGFLGMLGKLWRKLTTPSEKPVEEEKSEVADLVAALDGVSPENGVATTSRSQGTNDARKTSKFSKTQTYSELGNDEEATKAISDLTAALRKNALKKPKQEPLTGLIFGKESMETVVEVFNNPDGVRRDFKNCAFKAECLGDKKGVKLNIKNISFDTDCTFEKGFVDSLDEGTRTILKAATGLKLDEDDDLYHVTKEVTKVSTAAKSCQVLGGDNEQRVMPNLRSSGLSR